MDARDSLEVVTAAFLRDLEPADPSASCTRIDWDVTDLAAHLGAVHRWAAYNMGSVTRGDLVNRPELTEPVVEWYAAGRDELLAALAENDPDAQCYTLSKTDRTVRFWHRRQLFEALVHLWDLRSATDPGAPAPREVPPEVHADGVAELFDTFIARARDLEPLNGVVRLLSTDTDDQWTFGVDWERDTTDYPDAIIRGTAANLLLYVWNRTDNVEKSGDLQLIARFERASVRP
jgi:uncharacterized protein (TIGR03083 family)